MHGSLPERIFFRLSNRLLHLVSPDLARRRAARWVASHYDMVREENEVFFSRLYLHHIRGHISKVAGDRKLKILDAGCGQGRLALPLAADGHHVTGMDFTPQAIEKARIYAAERKLTAEFIIGDLEKDLLVFKGREFDCLICTEVLYMVKNYERILRELSSLVISGGSIFLSFRSRLFYVMHLLMHGMVEEAHRIAVEKDKYLMGGSLNCLSLEEIEGLMGESGIRPINFHGIGVLCGLEEDPQARLAIPASLTEEERELLFEMELAFGEKYPENGRYVLVYGVKS